MSFGEAWAPCQLARAAVIMGLALGTSLCLTPAAGAQPASPGLAAPALGGAPEFFQQGIFGEGLKKETHQLTWISSSGNRTLLREEEFTYQNGAWALTATLNPPIVTDSDMRELGVAEDGETVVGNYVVRGCVGSQREDEVAVWTREEGVWSAPVVLAQSGACQMARFGEGIAISGDGSTILVGAGAENGEPGTLWVFVRSGGGWAQQAEFKTVPGVGGCGEQVALSRDGDEALVSCGVKAEFFVREGGAWSIQGEPVSVPAAAIAMAPSGEMAIVSGNFRAGLETVVLERSGSTWTRSGTIPTVGPVEIAADEQTVLVGDAIYHGSGGSWVLYGEVPNLYKEERNPELGTSSAITADGETFIASGTNGTWIYRPGEALAGPEFGRCLLGIGKFGGYYTDEGCSKLPKGKSQYLWEPAAHKTGVAISGSGLQLSSAAKSTISCTSATGTGTLASMGALSGRKAVTGINFTLAGCQLAGEACTSNGAAAGQIEAQNLEAWLGDEKEGSKPKVGLAVGARRSLQPGEAAAEFSCGGTGYALRGAAIGSLKAGKPTTTLPLKFKSSKGAQKPASFAGGPPLHLELSKAGGPFEPYGLSGEVTLTYEEPIEIDPAI